MRAFVFGPVAVFALVGLRTIANAQQDAFNNFGPDRAYDRSQIWSIYGSGAPGGYVETAMEFQSATTGTLDTITSVFLEQYQAGNITVNIYKDNGSGAFGSLLYSSVDAIPTHFNNFVTFTNSNSSIKLNAGQNYWIDYAANVDPTVSVGWYFDWNGTHNQKVVQFTSPGGTPIARSGDGSLEVTTQSVPEPASIAALGLSLIGLMRLRKSH